MCCVAIFQSWLPFPALHSSSPGLSSLSEDCWVLDEVILLHSIILIKITQEKTMVNKQKHA